MTNLICTLLITTNTHWTAIKVEPSDRGCLVMNCQADHSEKRTEQESIYRVTQARIVFDGTTNHSVLKSEILPGERRVRVLYSGFDYEKPKWQWGFFVTNSNIR